MVHLRLRLLTRPGDKFVWEEAGASRGHKVDLYALDIGCTSLFTYCGNLTVFNHTIVAYTPERTTIRGIDDEIFYRLKEDLLYEGLSLIDYLFIPHYQSNYRKVELIHNLVEDCRKNDISFQAVRDGDVIIEKI